MIEKVYRNPTDWELMLIASDYYQDANDPATSRFLKWLSRHKYSYARIYNTLDYSRAYVWANQDQWRDIVTLTNKKVEARIVKTPQCQLPRYLFCGRSYTIHNSKRDAMQWLHIAYVNIWIALEL